MTMDSNLQKQLVIDAAKEIKKLRSQLQRQRADKHQDIAICGMSCRFPGQANNPNQFYQNVLEGKDGITEVPLSRWDNKFYYDKDRQAKGKIYTKYGGFIDRMDCFDFESFNISRKEAKAMDPQQRILLESTYHAFESAGIEPKSLTNSDVGVFTAINTFDYAFRMTRVLGQEGINAYYGIGNAMASASGRLAYTFGLKGPTLSVDTACSSSLVALHLACQSLSRGECSMVVVGGVNLMLSPELTINFCRAGMLAEDGRCKAFDISAAGYIRGEGCGVVILKTLESAEKDDSPILAVVKGSAINQDGASSGFTVPNGKAQVELIEKALKDANISAADVDYVEAHGTGTELGDPIEVNALARTYGKVHSKKNPLTIGSVKSNIGHLEAAAGLAGVIKMVQSLRYKKFLPSIHFSTPNPKIDWCNESIRVAVKAENWNKTKRYAAVSSFGFTGTNAHVVLGSYEYADNKKDPKFDPWVDKPLYAFKRIRVWFDENNQVEETKEDQSIVAYNDSNLQAMERYYQELSDAVPLANQTDGGESIDYLRFAPFREPLEGFSWLKAFQNGEVSDTEMMSIKQAQDEMKRVLYRGLCFDNIDTIADIGCGYGSDLIELASNNPSLKLHGFNISSEQVKVAQERVKSKGLNNQVTFFNRNSAEENWGQHYHLILSYQVIHHILNKVSIFRKISDHLDEGGLFVCAEILSNHSEAIHHDDSTAFFETKDFWAKELAANNLEIREAIETGREISNYLYDPHFYENLEKVKSSVSSESVHHLEGPQLLGELLRKNIAIYVLFRIQKTSFLSKEEILKTNIDLLSHRTPYQDAVYQQNGKNVSSKVSLSPEPSVITFSTADISTKEDVQEFLIELMKIVAEMEPEEIRFDEPISGFGIDSIMALEMKQSLEQSFSIKVPMTSFLEDKTLADLADSLFKDIDGKDVSITEKNNGKSEELCPVELAGKLDSMSDDEVETLYEKLFGNKR